MLAAFSLAAYHDGKPNYDTSVANPTIPSGNERDFSGVAYNPGTDTMFIVNNTPPEIFEYTRGGAYVRTVQLSGFLDTEGIVHLSGSRFAIVEEKGNAGSPNEIFHLSIFTMPAGQGVTLTKASLTQNLPNEGTIVFSHSLLNDEPLNNNGLEGIAWDPNGYFYVSKESASKRIFRISHTGGALQEVNIPDVTGPSATAILDISDIYFVRNADYPNGRMFIMSDDSTKIIMADMDATGLAGTVVTGDANDIVLPQQSFEGVGFSPDSFEMYAVSDYDSQIAGQVERRTLQYRNFTVYTAPAPNLDDDSDSGVLNNDDKTNDNTPTFSGTLTRSLATGPVPVENASVWLYMDNGANPVAGPVTTNASGGYSITAPQTGDGPHTFTIRVGEDDMTAAAFRSPASAALPVTIDTIAPHVIGVTVSGSLSVHTPYSVPVGSGIQIRTLPVGGADQFAIQFDEATATPTTSHFTAVGEKGTGTSYAVQSATWNAATNTATWRIDDDNNPASFFNIKAQLVITAFDTLTDVAGNRLDGDWTNPTDYQQASSDTFPSGNGAAQGNFAFYLTLLPGDFEDPLFPLVRDNQVLFNDKLYFDQNFFTFNWITSLGGDTNGDGSVLFNDKLFFDTMFGTDYRTW